MTARKAAGTKVVTDIWCCCKRTPGDPVRSPNWREVQDLAAADPNVDIPVNVNAYFMTHPEHVLGELGVRKGRFGPELTVTPKDGDLADQVRQGLTRIAEQARAMGLGATPPARDWKPLTLTHSSLARFDGLLVAEPDGSVSQISQGVPPLYPQEPQGASRAAPPDPTADTVRALLDAQVASPEETPADCASAPNSTGSMTPMSPNTGR